MVEANERITSTRSKIITNDQIGELKRTLPTERVLCVCVCVVDIQFDVYRLNRYLHRRGRDILKRLEKAKLSQTSKEITETERERERHSLALIILVN